MGKMPSFFATVTYEDGVIIGDGQEALVKRVHKDVDNHRRAMVREFEDVGCIWRIEWKARKSGVLAGWFVPHVHFLVYGVKDGREDEIGVRFRQLWLRMTGTGSLAARDVIMHRDSWKRIDGRKGVLAYVSKYTAKEGEDLGFATGRHWGSWGKVPKVTGFFFDIDAEELTEVRRFLDRWFEKKYPGFNYFSHQIIKGNTAYIYLNEVEVMQLYDLASDLAEEDFRDVKHCGIPF